MKNKVAIRKHIVFLLAMFCMLQAFTQGALSSKEALELLQKTDDSTSYKGTDFAANYTVVQDKPGQGTSVTTATMYRRDSKSSFTILILSPQKDKGKGYVQFDKTLWFYDPADRQFVFTSAKEKFQGTNANTSDFMPQNYCRDYSIKNTKATKLGKMDCILFELEAKVDNLNYPTVKLWVTRADGFIRKREEYSLSGQLLRTTLIPQYQLIKGKSVADKLVFIDGLRGKQIDGKMVYEKTQITVADVSFAKQSDITYTKKYVEMMSDR